MKLKSKDQIDEHIAAFPNIEPNRKKEIADHLTHLPDTHLPAVRAVLEKDSPDPEINFVRGCFEDAPAAAKQRQSNGEHPGWPTAA